MLAIGAVAELSLRNEMIGLTNSQVNNSLAAFAYSYAKARFAPPAARMVELQAFPGQPPGTVIALIRDDRAVFATVVHRRRAARGTTRCRPSSWKRSAGAAASPARCGWVSWGSHQVGSRDLGGGERLVSAVSLAEANATLARNAIIVAVLVLVAMLAAAAATVILVRHALRPLRRVAAIAGHVATLPLEAAEYRITARVSDRDTDPETEVGVVGQTLNRMLDNVDTALTKWRSPTADAAVPHRCQP